MADKVKRYDRGELKRPQRMDNGWVRVEGHLTRTGVFPYRNNDGTIRRELRLPEEVFHPDALKSFALSPLTDDHPPVFLTADNTREWARGAVGENVIRDGDFVRASLMVTDADLVAKLDTAEAREISCGYTCDLDFITGEHNGEKYDAIQRNIRGNHVAIVPRGRAGAQARVRMDGQSAAMISTEPGGGSGVPIPPAKDEAHVAFKVRIDGIDVEVVSEAHAQLLEKMQKAHADALKAATDATAAVRADLEKAIAKADSEAAKVVKLDAELKAAPAKILAEVSARADLFQKARSVLGKEAKFDGLTDRQVKEKVLAKTAPELKVDGKSDAYVDARFDLALEEHEDGGEDAIDTARRVADGADTSEEGEQRSDGRETIDADAAYEAMKKRHGEAYKGAAK